jgi:hypothetical protein
VSNYAFSFCVAMSLLPPNPSSPGEHTLIYKGSALDPSQPMPSYIASNKSTGTYRSVARQARDPKYRVPGRETAVGNVGLEQVRLGKDMEKATAEGLGLREGKGKLLRKQEQAVLSGTDWVGGAGSKARGAPLPHLPSFSLSWRGTTRKREVMAVLLPVVVLNYRKFVVV